MIPIRHDPLFTGLPTDDLTNWRHRSLYLSPEGLREWLRLSSAESYPGADPEPDPTLSSYLECLRDLPRGDVRHMVSLGPGDGRIDRQLLQHLSPASPLLDYVPVDISKELLQLSASRAAEVVTVPFAVCADFEARTNFLAEHLLPRREGNVLWSFLGNTFGALDEGEGNFCLQMRPLLRPGDFFLLSVASGPFRITVDPPFWDSLRELASTLSPIRKPAGAPLVREHDPNTVTLRLKGEHAPVASAVEFVDTRTFQIVLTIRSYRFEELLEWLTHRLPLRLLDQHHLSPSEAPFGMSVGFFRVV
jgi:hypothetical protein